MASFSHAFTRAPERVKSYLDDVLAATARARLRGDDIAEGVRRGLLDAMRSGTLAVGSHVRAAPLARALSVAPDRVERSLTHLTSVGLLEYSGRGRYEVKRVDGAVLGKALTMWSGLYSVLLAEVMPLVTRPVVSEMRARSERVAVALEDGDRAGAAWWNFAFYDRLVDLSGNQFLRAAISEPVDVARIGTAAATVRVDSVRLLSAHHLLVSALDDGDIDGAKHAITCAVRSALPF